MQVERLKIDIDPRLIMLERFPFPDEIEDLMGIRSVWECAYRSWRGDRGDKMFPDNVVMSVKSDPDNWDCEIDWFRQA